MRPRRRTLCRSSPRRSSASSTRAAPTSSRSATRDWLHLSNRRDAVQQWIALNTAAARVSSVRSVSVGAGQAQLAAALRSGVVRARGRGVAFGPIGDIELPSSVAMLPADMWNTASVLWERNLFMVAGAPIAIEIIEVEEGDLGSWLAQQPGGEEKPTRRKNGGGAPRKHDRDSFYCEIIRIADLDNLPERQ